MKGSDLVLFMLKIDFIVTDWRKPLVPLFVVRLNLIVAEEWKLSCKKEIRIRSGTTINYTSRSCVYSMSKERAKNQFE